MGLLTGVTQLSQLELVWPVIRALSYFPLVVLCLGSFSTVLLNKELLDHENKALQVNVFVISYCIS